MAEVKEKAARGTARSRAAAKPAADVPPPSNQHATAPVGAAKAEVNRFIAAYIMGVANRLANGASQYYRSRFDIGMSEWRALMAIGTSSHRIVREVAEMADLDYAAASKSLKLLQQRGYVAIEQTQRRGRAALASLTPEGLVVWRELCRSARRRQQRLLAAFTPQEVAQLWDLLHRIEGQIPHMNDA
jgi:DNA-binding MarR family transcriptional regulator